MKNAWPERKKITFAVSGSVLIHFLSVVALGVIFSDSPQPDPPNPEPEVAEITILPPPPPPEPESTPFLDVPDDVASKSKPDTPAFESDQNSLAASEAAPTGSVNRPAQEGRKADTIELATREYTPGDNTPPAPAVPPQPPSPPVAATQPKPTPVTDEREEPEQAPTPEPDTLAVLPPEPTPTPAKKETRRKTEDSELPRPPVPQRAPSLPGYQPEQRKTVMEGSVDTRGRSSVDAIGTPLGRYKKKISDAIGSRWYFYTTSQIDKISIGTARVRFFVSESGDVEDLEILSNDSNTVFETYTTLAIDEAEIPRMPEDIADTLPGRRLEVKYTFTVYGR